MEEDDVKKLLSIIDIFLFCFHGRLQKKNSDALYLYIYIYLCHVGVTWGLHMNIIKWFLYIELAFQYVFPKMVYILIVQNL